MTNKKTIAISIQGLEKYYGDFHAIKDISFEVAKGDFFGFLGPNGAGKTTTIHAISGLANFQKGSIQVLGQDVQKNYREARRLIGLCGQEFNFDPFLSLFQLLVYQAGYFGINKSVAQDRSEILLKRFKLWDKKQDSFRKLSGGMKRRLLICRSLVHDPEIIILDEPTAGADIELRNLIWEYLKELNAEGKTIFLTTHYMEEAERLCKSLAIIHLGQIKSIGPKADVLGGDKLEDVFMQITKSES
ncbi:MAG: ABC-2 type transport system ATP-binding protein [Candidatus Omnitrophota bacterium]|jgi:ABC-2 type transport system ATP-binding protein